MSFERSSAKSSAQSAADDTKPTWCDSTALLIRTVATKWPLLKTTPVAARVAATNLNASAARSHPDRC
jgi:hypothetical protein